ncbi:MAG: restriction endonuclease [Candidatus Cloacimonetes bacterium]|nr:restriction endonuclease [Candidatus Cloacimonadota bacterium]
MKNIKPEIKMKIISLSKCFWYWNSFYSFYSTILEIPKRKLEIRIPKNSNNKYTATEKILDNLERMGENNKIKEKISNFYKLNEPFDKNDNPRYIEAQKELKEFKNIVGKDVVEDEIKKREFKNKLEEQKQKDLMEQERRKKLEEIKNKFYEYTKVDSIKEKQNRGYWLEEYFYKLLELENIEHSKPYKTKTEQVDGHFKFKSFDYLVEIRWRKEQVKQKDISIFEGKIDSKGQSTRGFMLSISGFDQSAIMAAERKNPKLIFMDGNELNNILERITTFYDIFCQKEHILVKYGKVYKK